MTSESRDLELPANSSTGNPAARIRSASDMIRRCARCARSDSRSGVRKSSSRASRWWITCITLSTTQAIRR